MFAIIMTISCEQNTDTPLISTSDALLSNKLKQAICFESPYRDPNLDSNHMYSIVGKWKLMITYENDPESAEDRSCEEIIFEFHADNSLVVSTDLDWIRKGDHTYTYSNPETCPSCSITPWPYILSIDGVDMWCHPEITLLTYYEISEIERDNGVPDFFPFGSLFIRIV